MSSVYDDRISKDGEDPWGLHTGSDPTPDGSPKRFTISFGVKARLSRINIYPIQDDKHMYNNMGPRFYRIWGHKDPITEANKKQIGDDGGWQNEWKLLAEIENVKPSSLPVGSLSDEDRVAGRAGDEVIFPIDSERDEEFTVRYIRIESLRNWSGNTNICITEVTPWAKEAEHSKTLLQR
ncbi:hypothetical protein EZS27_018926 [termite gut metagenome]|uniref:DUF5000 domain-containing protein n=1 Tax=termite gut metagenome TaxID=433724 RepID=A0A5J4RGB2_9ZZZZ